MVMNRTGATTGRTELGASGAVLPDTEHLSPVRIVFRNHHDDHPLNLFRRPDGRVSPAFPSSPTTTTSAGPSRPYTIPSIIPSTYER